MEKEEETQQEQALAALSGNPNCIIEDRCHVWLQYNSSGEFKRVPLCNFNCHIESEEIRDDGQEQKTTFTIVGEFDNGSPLPKVRVDSGMFSSLQWVVPRYGIGAIIEPGAQTRDRLRYAIQVASANRKSIVIHTNLGWKIIERAWYFLAANGAIGADGFRDDIVVDPDEGGLHDFKLPKPPLEMDLVRSITASLELTKLGPLHVAYTLLSGTYRAATNEILETGFSLSLVGPTGVFKTATAILFQAHYGLGFKSGKLAGNWATTANANERKAFLVKDALLGVDDFVPEVNSDREADRLLRAQGNGTGRGRMRSDGTLRLPNYPRGIILSTGEEQFKGQSLRSRMMILELSRGDINQEALTKAQAVLPEGLYAKSMSGFLRWLAPRIDELKITLPKRQRELRELCNDSSSHKRTPDMAAHLGVGLELFLQYAKESNAINEQMFKNYWHEGWQALGVAAEMQAGHQDSEDPCTQFIELLTSAFVSGAAHLAHPHTNDAPDECKRWGWRSESNSTPVPKGERIGWLLFGEVWLQPDVAYAVVQKIAASQKTIIPISKDTMWKRLAQKKLITISQGEGKNLVKKTVLGGGRHRVVVFPNKEIFNAAPLAPEAPVVPGSAGAPPAGKPEVEQRRSAGDSL